MTKKSIYVIFLVILVLIGGIFVAHSPKVNIVYMSDSKYLPYMMVSLNSMLLNKNEKTQYHIHIIAKDMSSQEVQLIKGMQQKGVVIDVYPAKELNLNYTHLGRFASFRISLQKLFIAEYLPQLNKALYLDADTLVQKDLSQVYQTNINEKYAAAVKDGLMYQAPEHMNELRLKNPDFYFNSGVMLLNLRKIRKDDIIRKSVIYFNTHNEVFGDQDVLNSVFSGKVIPLSYQYNCISTFFDEKTADFLTTFWQEKVENEKQKVYANAAILHFAGYKPWTSEFTDAYLKQLWQQYADKTKAKYHITF